VTEPCFTGPNLGQRPRRRRRHGHPWPLL